MSSKHSGSEEGHQLSRQDSVIRSGILQANFRPVYEQHVISISIFQHNF